MTGTDIGIRGCVLVAVSLSIIALVSAGLGSVVGAAVAAFFGGLWAGRALEAKAVRGQTRRLRPVRD